MRKLALIILLAVTSQTALADAAGDLKNYLSNTQSLQASFKQTVTSQQGKVQQSSGILAIQRPGLFRWVYQKPFEQLIIADGKQVWLYDPDLKQATVKDIGKALESSPAALLAGNNQFERNYKLRTLASSEGVDWLEAIPKQPDQSFDAVKLGFTQGQLTQMELHDHFGQTTRIYFSALKINPKIDAGQFRFSPPKDADVIRE
ncbi:outer membrane lipoprotein chaperone LolA [Iodobacter fluviatilis]|uniref:Outer-membrane lipoprotein carrier protein n=1 Tax=Iodobacter fluviatilis TaxID=537 RepID=A0A377Q666_9NEIS|nr:outer membrane lipoprotein chaperone LolA [Iodobacter fluviatilis]TCU89396.1 outer membrane lipoprotein carrier protein [Iodobacter fluviatilis]STQ90766.1 Outer-membrane lipoprotein carrier protein precursor [Iodobacter fluviatilis]